MMRSSSFLHGIPGKVLAIILVTGLATATLGGSIFLFRLHHQLVQMYGDELEAIAATAAAQLSGEMGDLHEALVSDDQHSDEAWVRWRDALVAIRKANGLAEDLYTFRRDIATGQLRFAARSYDRPPEHGGRFLGQPYEPIDEGQRRAIEQAFAGHTAQTGIYSDALSDRRWITAYAPIRNSEGEVVGVLGVEVDAREIVRAMADEVQKFVLFALFVLLSGSVVGVLLASTLTTPLARLAQAAEALGNGDFSVRVDTHRRDEIGQLARAFDAMRRDLRALQEEAVHNARLTATGRMASSLIHDFKGPMTAISGFAQILARPDLPEERRRECVSEILQAIASMVEMTNDVLDYTRGTKRLTLTPVDAGSFVCAVGRATLAVMEEAGVTLRCESQFEGEVLVDEAKMRRVLFNLLTNAREAMPGGGQITLRSWREDSRWLLTVSDTGPGIPPEILDSVFEPFVTHGKAAGTGLGLAIAKQFVEQHGGTITLQTRAGEGTTFTISLPVKPPEAPAEEEREALPQASQLRA